MTGSKKTKPKKGSWKVSNSITIDAITTTEWMPDLEYRLKPARNRGQEPEEYLSPPSRRDVPKWLLSFLGPRTYDEGWARPEQHHPWIVEYVAFKARMPRRYASLLARLGAHKIGGVVEFHNAQLVRERVELAKGPSSWRSSYPYSAWVYVAHATYHEPRISVAVAAHLAWWEGFFEKEDPPTAEQIANIHTRLRRERNKPLP